MEICWCTPGKLRDFQDTSWPSTLEPRELQSPSMEPLEFPRKWRWCSTLTRTTARPSVCRTTPTFWIRVTQSFWNMNKVWVTQSFWNMNKVSRFTFVQDTLLTVSKIYLNEFWGIGGVKKNRKNYEDLFEIKFDFEKRKFVVILMYYVVWCYHIHQPWNFVLSCSSVKLRNLLQLPYS